MFWSDEAICKSNIILAVGDTHIYLQCIFRALTLHNFSYNNTRVSMCFSDVSCEKHLILYNYNSVCKMVNAVFLCLI